MAVVRGNVLSTPHARAFVEGVVALSLQPTSVVPAALNASLPATSAARILGTAAELNRPLSWWDLFCFWHVLAMTTPAGTGNRAHGGPIFLPWHRMYLRRFEERLQAASGDATFALPYWDWAADGDLRPEDQPEAEVWELLGTREGMVVQGPLAPMRVRLYQSPDDQRLYATEPRPLWRAVAQGRWRTLPTTADQAETLDDGTYDVDDWSLGARSFRNRIEGWIDPTEPPPVPQRLSPWKHNRVHVWVGGDMAPGSSPNDPVFWLNHCNVDRLWEAWMQRHGRTYAPAAGQGPVGHRLDDPMLSIVWPSLRVEQVLDPTPSGQDWYSYDVLPV